MKKTDLQKTIEKFWGEKESINQGNKDLTKTINVVLDQLDRGIIRICEKNNGIGFILLLYLQIFDAGYLI